ncbi:hypothetical protein SAMN05216249_11199 [Acetitomaculum ruminis DSM 5522]|uniref:Uncharacterized protein n=1 Tax=Acetitomaculum ruminis DSM 5522 TaxID=1120918 RepID=A0A1I0YVT5_9FIRM|nr:hypothetical protein SAMN05216249_11199 [Acetitomaculum ruminis DSM 5522]
MKINLKTVYFMLWIVISMILIIFAYIVFLPKMIDGDREALLLFLAINANSLKTIILLVSDIKKEK